MTVLTKEIADQLVRQQGSDLIIPEIYTSIDEYAFWGYRLRENNGVSLTSVEIPGSIKSIGDYAFLDNSLSNIQIPEGIISIGYAAFQSNQLKSVAIPASVTDLGMYAFSGNKISDIDIPKSLTSIPAGTFNSNQLTSFDIPEHITSIEANAFRRNQLASISIPEGITSIGNAAFAENNLSELKIPDSVVSIGEYAFWSNQLTKVIIPDTVTSIGEAAFQSDKLESITIGDGLSDISHKLLGVNPNLSSIYFGNGISHIAPYEFNVLNLKEIEIGEKVASIGTYAFQRNQLETLVIPGNVKTIGDYAFAINQLKNVEILDGVTSIGDGAFQYNRLSSVIIPNSVQSLGDYVFHDSHNATSLDNAQLESISIYRFAPFAFDESKFPEGVEIIRRNSAPSLIEISTDNLDENLPGGSVIAVLGTLDSDIYAGDTHSYSLISGFGDTSNSSFTIDGDQLKISYPMDFELNQALTCRIQTKDSGGLTGESTFMIYINDINEVPTDLAISELTFDENIASGSAVAILSTTDQDTGDTHTYSLVSGDGDVDNSLFTIESNQLKIVNSPDYENKDSYSIRLQTKDSGGLTFEKSFNFSVNDLNEIDYDFNGDNSVTIEEDAVIGVRAMFGTFPGDALINNALNNESSKSLLEIQQEMSDYFQDSRFDRDADGIISPFTDGIQMIREIEQLHLGGEAHFF